MSRQEGEKEMRISFDLDDTLICNREIVSHEPIPVWYRRLFVRCEPMRQETPELVARFRERGWEIWVYTTSLRSTRSIRRWLRSYGIAIDGVINQQVHSRRIAGLPGQQPRR